jgi:hypothetical protein
MEENDMYNVDFVCTYHFYDDSLLEKNPLSRQFKEMILQTREGEDVEISTYLYRNELLAALGLEVFDEHQAVVRIEEIHAWLRQQFPAVCETWDTVTPFELLFSYDSFHLVHMCMTDLLKKGQISEENAAAMEQLLSELTIR